MNRRTLFGMLVAAPAAVLAALKARAFDWSGNPAHVIDDLLTSQGLITDKAEVERMAAYCAQRSVPFRPGMRLRIVGKSHDGAWAAHTGAWQRDCVTDAETGAFVSNIQSIDVHIAAFGWVWAVVEVIEKTPDGRTVTERTPEGLRAKTSRHRAHVELDFEARSEMRARHEERREQLEECVRRADQVRRLRATPGYDADDDFGLDVRDAEHAYEVARVRLDELGGGV